MDTSGPGFRVWGLGSNVGVLITNYLYYFLGRFLMIGDYSNTGALIITYTIFGGVPDYKYSIMGPQNPSLILKALLLWGQGCPSVVS